MIINGLDGYYTVFDTKNRNTELDTLPNNYAFTTARQKPLAAPSGRALPNLSGRALPNPSLEGLSFSYGLSVRIVSSGFKHPVPNLSSPRGDRRGLWGGLLNLF